MRKWGVVVAVLGVLLLAGAAVLRFVVVPNGQVLPADTDETIVYGGTLTTLDQAALASGDAENAVNKAPIKVRRHVEVLQTDGNKARVRDSALVTDARSGETLSDTAHIYTVDRKTLFAIPNFTDLPAEKAEGIVMGFPVTGVEKSGYVGWVDEVEQTARVHYRGEAEVRGLPVYEYGGQFSAELDETQLPPGAEPSIPKAELPDMVAAMGLSADQQQQLADAMPMLPDQIPLTYTYSTDDSYSVEPNTGEIVDLTRTTGTSVSMPSLSDEQFPVYESTVFYTPRNITDQVNGAKDNVDALQLYGTTIPIVLGALGLVALIASIPMIRHRRREEQPPPPTPSHREPAMTP